jgi:VanZ family protein
MIRITSYTTIPRALPCLIYLLVVGWMSLQPQETMPQEVSDKLLHTVVYAGAALLWGWAALTSRAQWFGLPLLIGYGFVLEFAQALTPDRTPSVADAFANSGGIVLGLALIAMLRRLPWTRHQLRLSDFARQDLTARNQSQRKPDLPSGV